MEIRRLEELSMNAWPALHTNLYDGWVARFSAGYTRRANSVYPLYPSTLDTQHKIEVCEQAYRAQGLRPVFKLTPAAVPPDLDDLLEARGYECEAPTSVQTADLAGVDVYQEDGVELAEAVTEVWMGDFCRLSHVSLGHLPTMRAMLGSIVPRHAFATVRIDGAAAACGLVVLEDGCAGLHDIVTHPDLRRQGHGRQLVLGLLRWAREQGAHTGWLGVMADNEAAQRLYAGFGFAEVYRYWYRVAEA